MATLRDWAEHSRQIKIRRVKRRLIYAAIIITFILYWILTLNGKI